MIWVLRFAHQEGKRRGGNTFCVLVAGEEIDEDLGTWRRAAAVAQSGGERKRERESTRVEAWKVAACGGRR